VRTFAVDALRGAEILDVPALEIGDGKNYNLPEILGAGAHEPT
jgi:hypothetical protein